MADLASETNVGKGLPGEQLTAQSGEGPTVSDRPGDMFQTAP
jgi:hypothetical protein